MHDFDSSGPLILYINGQQRRVSSPDPSMTLLTYLRTVEGLTGTKLGCGEGGCGACTVMLSSCDASSRAITHLSANACLTPLCSLDGCAVTTVEGIGGMREGLHPVQQRLAQFHGSQCGYCTPGIVMSLYAQLRSYPDSTPHELEECLDGNLCRCTGYRPIIDAAKSLSNNKCCGGGDGGGCPCRETGRDEGRIGGTINSPSGGSCGTTHSIVCSHDSMEREAKKANLSEPIFPPALMAHVPKQLLFRSPRVSWFQPTSYGALLQLKALHPDARIIIGNTEVGIETKFKGLEYAVLINPVNVRELQGVSLEDASAGGRGRAVRVGASVTLNSLRRHLEGLAEHSLDGAEGIRAIAHMLTWFASNQIRNVASIAGNIVTASPISDLNPMLIACNAVLRMRSISGSRDLPISQFFLAYRKVDLQPNEVLESVLIPLSEPYEFVVPLKQARRREDDISIVTAGIRVRLRPHEGSWVVADCCAAFGGMAPRTIATPLTAQCLLGRPWGKEALDAACEVLRGEVMLPDSVPGGQPEYRVSLAVSFLFKAFLAISNELSAAVAAAPESLPAVPEIDPREKSGSENFVTASKPETRGLQSYFDRSGGMTTFYPTPHTPSDSERGLVGQPLMHKSALAQAAGSAVYTGDMPLPRSACHAALVTSTRAHARLLSVDAAPAAACEGFVAFLSAKDVTGSNHIGAVIKDEEVFVTEFVKHYGAVIGIVVADTHEQAVYASKKVVCAYEDLPPIISIDDAIKASSFYPAVHEIASGPLEEEEARADVVVEGRGRVGGQEHFYLETNCTVAIPYENNNLEVFSSTQNPTKTQNFCASVCGLPASNVVARTKRLGGGFGGKETRSVFVACTAALAAHLLRRPVSINVERDVDMSITGQRHAFVVDYRAGCTKDGNLCFLDLRLYSNAGFSLDLSQPIMDRALLHCDGVYRWPALRASGTICRTNQPSHTAFRGFGGPQGMMATEFAIEHLARLLRMPPEELREKNLYQEGDTTHFCQRLEQYYVPKLWRDLLAVARVAERGADVAAFNKANRWRKRGLCTLGTKFGINFTAKFMNQGGALVHVYTDGSVLVSHGGTEMGQGLHTKVIQVAAQCLGIPDSMVHISETATNVVANSSPTAASMSTDLYGMAVLDACEQILQRLRPLRDQMPDASWKTLVSAAFFQRIDLSAHGFYAVHAERCGYDFDKPYEHRGFPFNYFTQVGPCSTIASNVMFILFWLHRVWCVRKWRWTA